MPLIYLLILLIGGAICALLMYCQAVSNWHFAQYGATPAAKFELAAGELCHGPNCEPAMLLKGLIDAHFVDNLRTALDANKGTAKWLCLASPGGNVEQAMRAAKEIQDRGLNTCVVPTYRGDQAQQAKPCASSCAYLFGAGSRRVLNGPYLKVHPVIFGVSWMCIPCNIAQSPFAAINTHEQAKAAGLANNSAIAELIDASHAVASPLLDPGRTRVLDEQEFLARNLGTAQDVGAFWRFILRE